MSTYTESWAPETLEQAMLLIDTTHDGDAFWNVGELIADEAMAHAPADAATVVEYGCGVGRAIGAVTAPTRIGVDVSQEMLDLAASCYPDVDFRRCDGRSLPVDDDTACFVFSALVLQHMDAGDVAGVVADVARALHVGGRCYLRLSGFGTPWTPTATVTRGPLQWTGARNGSWSPAHGTLAYTPEIAEALAAEAGLEVLAIEHLVLDEYHHDYALLAEKP